MQASVPLATGAAPTQPGMPLPASVWTCSAPGLDPATEWQRRRVALTYWWRHRRLAQLHAPTRFTELVQLRKLHERDSRIVARSDKVTVKALVAQALGPEWITPTLWHGTQLPPELPFATPSILKARHGCNQYAVLRCEPARREWAVLRRRSVDWMRRPYGLWLDEWAYRHVVQGLLAEALLTGTGPLPADYKVYVFGGQATHVQVHMERGRRHRWVLHDRNGRKLCPSQEDTPAMPRSLPAMLAAAEVLGRDFSFVRIDFYEIDGAPRFGEFSFYPGSGLDPFAEDWIDEELGRLWLVAL